MTRKRRTILMVIVAAIFSLAVYILFFMEIDGVVDQIIPPMGEADVVEVRRTGIRDPFMEITNSARIDELREFVNSYSAGWTVPLTGPPVGELYFDFYREGELIGNFYYGPGFFGRDHGGFFSRSVTDEETRKLSSILESAFVE